jgi:hypothetical protein
MRDIEPVMDALPAELNCIVASEESFETLKPRKKSAVSSDTLSARWMDWR